MSALLFFVVLGVAVAVGHKSKAPSRLKKSHNLTRVAYKKVGHNNLRLLLWALAP
jgi:hypothetical protein